MKEKLEGVTRHVLTFIGGILVAKGVISEEIMIESVGIIISIIGLVLSIKNKS